MTSDWPKGIGAPAQRALTAAGYSSLESLTSAKFVDIARLHGVGPKAMKVLEDALIERGLAFGEPAPTSKLGWARAMQGQHAQNTRPDGKPHTPRGTVTPKEKSGEAIELEVGDRRVRLSSPDRVYFPDAGWTKRDVANYYVAVGPGILRALRERPTMLHRFPKGLAGPKVHQKRLPAGAPDWVNTVELHFPRYDLTADELCPEHLAEIIWAVQMSTVEFHPWNVRRSDVDRPDEWRIDIDPMPKAGLPRTRRVAGVVHEVLDELGIEGFPKTSGGNGIHVDVRIKPRWEFADVRRAAWGFAREVERRMPNDVTTTWWRKDRNPEHVFIDFNQNARDHTVAAAYSLRGVPAGTVSTPLRWDEVDAVEPRDFTLATVPARFAELGDLRAGIDERAYDLSPLLEWADKFERDGSALGEAPDAG